MTKLIAVEVEGDQAVYDVIFDAALSMNRAATQTNDLLGISMSHKLFMVINEWEKNPSKFPRSVFDAAFQVAIEWERITTQDV